MNEQLKNTIKQRSADAEALLRRIIKVQVDEVITYSDLSGVIHRDVQNDARHVLQSARRAAMKEHGMVFDCVMNVGLKRLNDVAIVEGSDDFVRKIRRTAGRGAKQTLCANYDKLNKDEKIKFNTNLSLLGAVRQFTQPAKRNLIEQQVINANAQVPFAETMKLMTKNA